jgi:hypothetical protein
MGLLIYFTDEFNRENLFYIQNKRHTKERVRSVTRPDFIRESFAVFKSDFCEAGKKMMILASDMSSFYRDDFIAVMSFVELQTVPFQMKRAVDDLPIFAIENSGALYSFIRLQMGKKKSPKETGNEMVKLGDYMAFQFEPAEQKGNRDTIVQEVYTSMSKSVGSDISVLFAHAPIQFMFIPAKSSMTDATIYTQTNKMGRTTLYSVSIPVSSDKSQKETVAAAFAACLADKLSSLPKIDELISANQQPIPSTPIVEFSSPSISFYRQVNEGETNKEAKMAVERTAKCYRAILNELVGLSASPREPSPSFQSIMSILVNESPVA